MDMYLVKPLLRKMQVEKKKRKKSKMQVVKGDTFKKNYVIIP